MTTLIVTHDATVSQHVRRTIQIRDGRTATETLRRQADANSEELHAEEFAVLDKVGRLQLPQGYVDALGLRERVRLTLEPEHIEVRPGLDSPQAPASSGDGVER